MSLAWNVQAQQSQEFSLSTLQGQACDLGGPIQETRHGVNLCLSRLSHVKKGVNVLPEPEAKQELMDSFHFSFFETLPPGKAAMSQSSR